MLNKILFCFFLFEGCLVGAENLNDKDSEWEEYLRKHPVEKTREDSIVKVVLDSLAQVSDEAYNDYVVLYWASRMSGGFGATTTGKCVRSPSLCELWFKDSASVDTSEFVYNGKNWVRLHCERLK